MIDKRYVLSANLCMIFIFWRSKKRGFFAISNALSSSGDKKRNKGSKQGDPVKENKPEFRFLNKGKTEQSINVHGDYQEFEGVTDDELEPGDATDSSSTDVETAGTCLKFKQKWKDNK